MNSAQHVQAIQIEYDPEQALARTEVWGVGGEMSQNRCPTIT